MPFFLFGKPFLKIGDDLTPVGFQGQPEIPRSDDMKQILHLHQFQVVQDPQLAQQHSERTRIFRGPYPAELVQGHLELKPSPAETGGAPPGNIVPLQQQHLESLLGQRDRGGEPAVSGPDHHHIIGFHKKLPYSA